jgi:gas vesicle protein
MELETLLTGFFAGGLGGQLVTLLLAERSTRKREHDNWLREQRFKSFSHLVVLVSTSAPRTDYDVWPTNIRSACQEVNMLFPSGKAPKQLTGSMERIFQLAKQMKKGDVKNHDVWTDSLRDEARILREGLSEQLHEHR